MSTGISVSFGFSVGWIGVFSLCSLIDLGGRLLCCRFLERGRSGSLLASWGLERLDPIPSGMLLGDFLQDAVGSLSVL